MNVLKSAQNDSLEATDTPVPDKAGEHKKQRRLIVWGSVGISALLVVAGVFASIMAGERMSAEEVIDNLKVAAPSAKLYNGKALVASPSSTDLVQLISAPVGYWSALGRVQVAPLQTSSDAVTTLNGRRERHFEPLVKLFTQVSALEEAQTQGVLGELTILDERLTFKDLWVIAGSARESRVRRNEPLRSLRVGFYEPEQSLLQTLSLDISADPINKIDGLKILWGSEITMRTNLEGEDRTVGRLPTRVNARELEKRAEELLSHIDWTQTYQWVSFEATSDVMLSEFYTLARLIHSLSAPGVAQRGGTPLRLILHLKQ